MAVQGVVVAPRKSVRPGGICRRARAPRLAIMAAVAAAMLLGSATATLAATPLLPFLGAKQRPSPFEPDTSEAARQSAIQSIPFERLDADARAKAREVLSRTSVFRRMPVQVIDCDPHLYLFLLEHPDVIVNIWKELRISRLKLTQIDPGRYEVIEPAGTECTIEYLYDSHDTPRDLRRGDL